MLRPYNYSTANCHIELSEKPFLYFQGSSEQKAIQRFLIESKRQKWSNPVRRAHPTTPVLRVVVVSYSDDAEARHFNK